MNWWFSCTFSGLSIRISICQNWYMYLDEPESICVSWYTRVDKYTYLDILVPKLIYLSWWAFAGYWVSGYFRWLNISLESEICDVSRASMLWIREMMQYFIRFFCKVCSIIELTAEEHEYLRWLSFWRYTVNSEIFYVVSFTTYAVFDTYLDIPKFQYLFVVLRTILLVVLSLLNFLIH